MGDLRGLPDDAPCDECGVRHEPIVDDIGVAMIEHGERYECTACLCGSPYYLLCEEFVMGHGTVENVVLYPGPALNGGLTGGEA